MRTHKPSRFVTYVSLAAMMLAFLAPTTASAQTVGADICAAVDINGDGIVVQADIDLAVLNNPLLAVEILANVALILGGGCASDATTTGSTVGATDGSTTGNTVGVTDGATTGSTVGVTDGATTGSTVGVTDGATTGSTVGVTDGATTGSTVGVTDGATTGSTVGATDGATTGSTVGVTDGATTAGTTGTTAGTSGTTAGTTGTTAGTSGTTAGSTTGSAVAQVTGLPSTGTGNSTSVFVWPMVAASSVILLVAGQFVISRAGNRNN